MYNDNHFYIRIQSPVHVGCDEVYEPMGFVVDETAAMLTTFDPLDFFRSLDSDNRARYASISRKGTIVSLLELYGFMKGKRFSGYDVKMAKGFIEHYRQTLSMKPFEGNARKVQQELNNFTIARTSFNAHDNQPYIPGSAVKGALRTAYLNLQQKTKKLPDIYRDARKLEVDLLDGGSFNTDPFRLLKISDFIPVQATTRIVYAVNEKKTPSKFNARGPYQILEIIEPNATFTGTITIDERFAEEAGIKSQLSAATLLKSADAFYTHEFKRENDELMDAGLPGLKASHSDGGWKLRIGRHSGAESVTIDGHRNIRIMQGKGKPPAYSKSGACTFWLVSESRANYPTSQLQPFGWVTLGKLTEEMYNTYNNMIEENRRNAKAPIHNIMAENSPEATLSSETKTAIVLSPLEIILTELKMINATDAGRIGTIIQKIDHLEGDANKAAVAAAIRDKIGAKVFKKHKKKDYLESLIAKMG